MRSLTITILCVLMTAPLAARDFGFTEKRQIDGIELERCGAAAFRFLGFIRIFEAALYRPPNAACTFPIQSSPVYLELEYNLDVTADEFRELTIRGVREAGGEELYANTQTQVEAWNQLYKNIESGERYGMWFTPADGTVTLIHDGKRLGRVRSAEFAHGLLSIWLGEKSMDARLRKKLLAGAS